MKQIKGVGTDGKIILAWILGTSSGKTWTRCAWLRTGTNDKPLWTQ